MEQLASSMRCSLKRGILRLLINVLPKLRNKMSQSFEPIASPKARVLVLGTIPGQASLEVGEYYANSRNLFWPFMCELFSLDASLSYSERCRLLSFKGIAVWDVLAAAVRPGSLDASIVTGSEQPNDFQSFFATHPMIASVFFNGATTERLFRRHVLPQIALPVSGITLQLLPSTSPANTTCTRSDKLDAWRIVARAVDG